MIRAALLSAALWLAALGAAQAQELPDGTNVPDVPAGEAVIRGRLVRADAGPLADALVILYSLAPDGSPGLRSGRADAQGAFAFEGISGDPGIVYLVGARVGGVPYGARATFSAGQQELRVEIPVSQPTESLAKLERGDLRLRLERGCTHLRVRQAQVLTNDSDRVIFVPPERRAEAAPLLRMQLPEGAEGFETLASAGSDGLVLEGGSLRFWGPLHPGRHEIEWAFGLPLRDALPLRVGLPDGAPGGMLLLPRSGMQARGEGLVAEGVRELAGGAQALYRFGAIAAGGALELALEVAAAPEQTRPGLAESRLWLELDDVALDVSEQHTLKVEGEEILASDGSGPLLCLPLPPGAQEIRFATGTLGLGLSRDPSGALALHGPVPPGETPLALRYRLPSGGGAAPTRFARRFGTEVPLLEVFVADTGLLATSPRLHRRRPIVTEDRMYLHLEAFALERDEEVEIALEPLPARRASSRALASGAVLLGARGAAAFQLAPQRGGRGEVGAERESAAATERESIYRAIDALDEDLETGKLTPQDHEEMRSELRARAMALIASERAGARAAPAAAAATAPAAAVACARCAAPLRAGDRFCSQCGAAQEPAGARPA
jgi:hypothetical protein